MEDKKHYTPEEVATMLARLYHATTIFHAARVANLSVSYASEVDESRKSLHKSALEQLAQLPQNVLENNPELGQMRAYLNGYFRSGE